ncbi:MAG: ATP-binding protein [Deltaproteobacteria bacterium]|nr:ATP-binding protein [Deltaproteobacteria bacterium]
MYSRILDVRTLLAHKSLFLFGPRQTGKSTLLQHFFPQAKFYDLLEANTFRELTAQPELIRQRLQPQDAVIVIDEVQKLPSLLDEVHLLIERHKALRFVLTGSSVRKLKRGGANLLAGRAWTCHLFPLASPEVNFQQLEKRLNIGSLPAILDAPYPLEDLKAYVGTYLKEEIQAEGLTRSIEHFSRFLPVVGLMNGEQVNFTAIASDAGVPPRVVREYYEILEDTRLGFLLPPFQQTKKRKAVATAKFYLFDIGVANVLARRGTIEPGSDLFGRALEHLLFLELQAFLGYQRRDEELTFWRSLSQMEVDFVVGDRVAIEVKGKGRISRRDYKGLLALAEEIPLTRKMVVSLESEKRLTDDGIEVYPVQQFLRELWAGEIITTR